MMLYLSCTILGVVCDSVMARADKQLVARSDGAPKTRLPAERALRIYSQLSAEGEEEDEEEEDRPLLTPSDSIPFCIFTLALIHSLPASMAEEIGFRGDVIYHRHRPTRTSICVCSMLMLTTEPSNTRSFELRFLFVCFGVCVCVCESLIWHRGGR